MKIPQDSAHLFPETRPTGNQCGHLKNVCPSCGGRFEGLSFSCTACGGKRPRCGNAKMKNEDACRVHAKGRHYSLYTMLVGRMADVAFEDVLERNDRSLDQEFALAKVALTTSLSRPQDQTPSPSDLLEMIERFFRIAEKMKKIEEGEYLNIKIDDTAAAEMRKQTKRIVGAVKDALEDLIPSETLRMQIMTQIRANIKLKGNLITLPSGKSQGKQWYQGRDNDTKH